MPKSLTPRLMDLKLEIEGYAKAFGLDCFETIFEILSTDELNMVASYGGFPTRYPHWRWGMEYEQLSKSSEYGLSKIYELVINNDPCYAYLLEANAEVDQKLADAKARVVLLCPGAPSFDEFESYEHKAAAFRRTAMTVPR
mgnify:CR=1 FL=1